MVSSIPTFTVKFDLFVAMSKMNVERSFEMTMFTNNGLNEAIKYALSKRSSIHCYTKDPTSLYNSFMNELLSCTNPDGIKLFFYEKFSDRLKSTMENRLGQVLFVWEADFQHVDFQISLYKLVTDANCHIIIVTDDKQKISSHIRKTAGYR